MRGSGVSRCACSACCWDCDKMVGSNQRRGRCCSCRRRCQHGTTAPWPHHSRPPRLPWLSPDATLAQTDSDDAVTFVCLLALNRDVRA